MTATTRSRIRRTFLQALAGGGATAILVAASSGRIRDAAVAASAAFATFLVAVSQNLLEDTTAVADHRV